MHKPSVKDQIVAAAFLYDRKKYSEALVVLNKLDHAASGIDAELRAVALSLAANCSIGLGNQQDAEKYWRLAIKEKPEFAEAHCKLGILFKGLGRRTEAENAFRRALDINPQSAEAHYHLGLLLHEAKRLPEAAASFRRVLAIQPGLAAAHNCLGMALHQLGDLAEAESAYRAALAANPEYAEAHCNIANLFVSQNRPSEAQAACMQAIRIQPGNSGAYNNLACAFIKLNSFREAEDACRQALVVRPEYAEAYCNLGIALYHLNRLDEAETAFGQALSVRPDYVEVYDHLARVLADLGRLTEAETACRQATLVRPGYAEVYYNSGVRLHQLGHVDAAEAAMRQAISIRPDYELASLGLGILLLNAGKYAEGWPLYEYRYDERLARRNSFAPKVACAQWAGESLQGQSLLVWHEQGYGDMIQFGRFLHMLKAQGARHVTLACRPALHRLFRGLEGIDAVATPEEAIACSGYDFWMFLLSAPRRFNTTVHSIPHPAYIEPAQELVGKWRSRLQSLSGYKVGLVWKGSPTNVNDKNRSLPSLATLAPLWDVPGISFVSLQKGAGGVDAQASAQSLPILDVGPDLEDFAETAAVIAGLDLVICVETAVAHLAGALGKPCWVLLEAAQTEWRWLQMENGPVWYPRTTRLFRQAIAGDWATTVLRVREACFSEFAIAP